MPPLGVFDTTAVPEGWFSEVTQAPGWFHKNLLDVISGGGGTTFPVTVTFTAIGTLTRQQQVNLLRSFTAVGTSTFSRVANRFRSIAINAIGTASLARQASFFRSLSYTATGTVSLAKGLLYTVTKTFTAVGTVVSVESFTSNVIKTFTAVGTAAMTALYIPFTPPAVISRVLQGFRRLMARVRQ